MSFLSLKDITQFSQTCKLRKDALFTEVSRKKTYPRDKSNYFDAKSYVNYIIRVGHRFNSQNAVDERLLAVVICGFPYDKYLQKFDIFANKGITLEFFDKLRYISYDMANYTCPSFDRDLHSRISAKFGIRITQEVLYFYKSMYLEHPIPGYLVPNPEWGNEEEFIKLWKDRILKGEIKNFM